MEKTPEYVEVFNREVTAVRDVAPPGAVRTVTSSGLRLVTGRTAWQRTQLKLTYPPSFGTDKSTRVSCEVEAPQLAPELVRKLVAGCEAAAKKASVGSQGAAAFSFLLEASRSRLLYCYPEVKMIKTLVKASPPSEMKASEKSGSIRLALKCGEYVLSVTLSVPDAYPDVPVGIKVASKTTSFPKELVQPFVSQANDACRRCAAGVEPEVAMGASNPVRLPGKIKREDAEAAVAKVTAESLRGLKSDLAFYRRTKELHAINDKRQHGDARRHANSAAERKAARNELKRAIKRELAREEAALAAAEAELRKKAVEEAGAMAAAVAAAGYVPSTGTSRAAAGGAGSKSAAGRAAPAGDSDASDGDDDEDSAALRAAEAAMDRVDAPLGRARPSLWVAAYVLACRFALYLPRARCCLSHRRLIPRSPPALSKVMSTAGAKKESPRLPVRAFCGHWFHLAPLDEMMRRPPWPSMCPREGCGARLLHRRWPVETKGLEKAWARKQEKIREREDVADALDLIGLGDSSEDEDEEGGGAAAAGGLGKGADGFDVMVAVRRPESPAVGPEVRSVGDWSYKGKKDDEGGELVFDEDASFLVRPSGGAGARGPGASPGAATGGAATAAGGGAGS